jgi:hypothetical protein
MVAILQPESNSGEVCAKAGPRQVAWSDSVWIVEVTVLHIGTRGQREKAFSQTSSGLPNVDEPRRHNSFSTDSIGSWQCRRHLSNGFALKHDLRQATPVRMHEAWRSRPTGAFRIRPFLWLRSKTIPINLHPRQCRYQAETLDRFARSSSPRLPLGA